MSQKPITRVFIILSIVSFVGSTAFGAFGLFSDALKPPNEDAKTAEAQSKDSQLQAIERGYEAVLQREPENQVALQGLVQARLQMNNFKGAVAPLEKLVKLNPGGESYKALLAEVKHQAGKKGKGSK